MKRNQHQYINLKNIYQEIDPLLSGKKILEILYPLQIVVDLKNRASTRSKADCKS